MMPSSVTAVPMTGEESEMKLSIYWAFHAAGASLRKSVV
jgi:hypothetical protein